MSAKLTPRQEAEAIERFGDDLIHLNAAFDKLCKRMSPRGVDAINAIADQDKLTTIAGVFIFEGQRYCAELDAADALDDDEFEHERSCMGHE